MNKSIIISEKVRQQMSARSGLVGLGIQVKKLGILEPLEQQVKIAQKTVKYTPGEKLADALIAILAGARGLVEVNKRVRSDPALQAAFGRKGCAEQSVIQETLDASSSKNVAEIEQVVDRIFRLHSQTYRHDFEQPLVLEVDMTGRPCGRKAAFASKGYFAKQRNRRGRQEGYVVASQQQELVVKRLYEGTTQLPKALQPLVEAAEKTLELTPEKRRNIILRIDSGGGSVDDVNWALKREYHVHTKDYSGRRAEDLAESVKEWFPDPADANRQMGWVTEETTLYERPIKRIAVRCRKNNGQWGTGVILSSLPAELALRLTNQKPELVQDNAAVLLAYVHFYDQRGGGIEIEIKEDKQGLGTSKRNKKRFPAQQVLCQLETLAHNLLVWARRWLAPFCPKVGKFGLLRLVRDAFQVTGIIAIDQSGNIVQITLNPADPLAKELLAGLSALIAHKHLTVCLGES